MMRIVSGQAGGIVLNAPKGLGVRPTSIRSRQALFDSLGHLSGFKLLDLFAGSGTLGLEAASRGASEVIFVEKNRGHCRCLESNIEKVAKAGVTCRFQIVSQSVAMVDFSSSLFKGTDLIIADPPYAQSSAFFETFVSDQSIREAFQQATTLIWELPHDKQDRVTFLRPALWTICKQRTFGRTDFLFLKTIDKQPSTL